MSLKALMEQAHHYATAGDDRQALEIVSQLKQLPPPATEEILSFAQTLIEAQLPMRAMEILAAVTAKDPANVEAMSLRGIALAKMGQYKEALDAGKQAVSLSRQKAEMHYRLALIFSIARMTEEANLSCDRALKLDKQHADALVLSCKLRVLAGAAQEAVFLLGKIIEICPHLAEAYAARGEILYNHAVFADAFSDAQHAIRCKPWMFEAWMLKANILHGIKRYDEEMPLLTALEGCVPANREVLMAKALCLVETGKPGEGMALLERLCAEYPEDTEINAMVAAAFMKQGDNTRALTILDGILELHPNDLVTRLNRITCQFALHKYESVIADCDKVLEKYPENTQAHTLRSRSCLILNRNTEALKSAWMSIRLDESNFLAWDAFAQALAGTQFTGTDPAIEKDLLRCLSFPIPNRQGLWSTVLRYMMHMPALEKISELAWEEKQEEFDQLLNDASGWEVLAHPLMLELLKEAIIPSPALERVHTQTRRSLMRYEAQGISGKDERALLYLQALARQCFVNEYVYFVSDEEKAAYSALEEKVRNALQVGTVLEKETLLLISYKPLYYLKWMTDEWAETLAAQGEKFRDLVRLQWSEPMRERVLQQEMEVLTPIEDDISRAVQSQYESNPYPRWVKIPETRPSHLQATLKRALPSLREDEGWTIPMESEVLIAGCGTGQHPLGFAQPHPATRVIAIDLSFASLGYAKRKAEEYGIKNIRFAQADILALPGLGKQYDYIESAGVIHHMRDPMEGWAALLACLKPEGVLRLALYSELARQGIVAAREFIQVRGYGSTAEDIRACRQEMFRVPKESPVSLVLQSNDFYSLSSCRDLIFHVQEHRFTIPLLKQALEHFGMEFLGFMFEQADFIATEYIPRFPDDPLGVNLDNWLILEEANPLMFSSMYNFFARRKKA